MLIQTGRGAGSNAFDVRLIRADANAGGKMGRQDFDQLRFDLSASVDGISAASTKTTTARRVNRRGHVAFERYSLSRRFSLRVGNRDRRYERLRIGHQRS